MFKTLFLSLVLILIIVPSLFSGTVQLNKLSEKRIVFPQAEYLEDRTGNLTADDVKSKKYEKQWISSDKETLSFGYTDSVYWFRFDVQNRNNIDIEYFLEHRFPTADDLKLFIYNKGNLHVIETGDTKPFSSRSYNYRNFVFPLKTKANSSTTFYIRQATNDSMAIWLGIWSPEAFHDIELANYGMLSLFYGIILIMIVYNFIIFLFIRRIEYLYYVLFIASFLMLMMIVNGTAFQFLWPDSPGWANFSLPLFLVILLIFLGLFSSELVQLRKVRDGIPHRQMIYKMSNAGYFIYIITYLTFLFAGYRHMTAVAVFLISFTVASILIYGIILIVKERNRFAMFGLFASSAMMFGSLAFILMAFGILPASFFAEWSLYIGSVFMIAIFSFALADRINNMTITIMKAEKKYRELVERSDDIIFSLDDKMNFLTVNRAIRKHLGYYENNVVGKNFLDFIHEKGQVSKHITREVVEGYIDDLKLTKKGTIFKTDFKKRHTHEPIELSVKFEYAESEDRKEKILGKASPLIDDTILKYMKSEKNIYEAENYLNNAELLSQRLTLNLYRFVDKSIVSNIRLSLREILVNAIEHGNLDIDFEGKTNAMAEGNYLKYILERQKNSLYRDKKIHVDYQLTENSVTYTIADEGNGFDHQNIDNLISEKSNEEFLSHGRGILLVKQIFDKVEFNEKGNQVTLVKDF